MRTSEKFVAVVAAGIDGKVKIIRPDEVSIVDNEEQRTTKAVFLREGVIIGESVSTSWNLYSGRKHTSPSQQIGREYGDILQYSRIYPIADTRDFPPYYPILVSRGELLRYCRRALAGAPVPCRE